MGKESNFDKEFFFENIRSNIDSKIDDFEDISSSSKDYNADMDIDNNPFEVSNNSHQKNKHASGQKANNGKNRISKWWNGMKKSKKRLLVTLVSIILIIVMFFLCGGMKLFYNYYGLGGNIGFKGTIDQDIMNIALFGIDSRDTQGKSTFSGNSDSIMILSLNKKSKKIKIISLLRDTFVPIEKEEGQTSFGKINSAYALGGPELAVKTINTIFHLDISEFATVNFYGMSDIIEAVGGIDVELTQNEVTARGNNNHGINDMIQEICVYENLNPNDYYVNNWGQQHLNGIQAVAYSRIRYCTNIWGTSNDYGRTDRQRFVMNQLFNAVKDLDKSKYIKLANALVPCTQTSLEPNKILSIGWSMLLSKPEFEEYRIPMTSADADREKGENGADYDFLISPTPSGYGSVIYIDLEYASKVIHAILYEDMTAKGYIAEHPIEKNTWYPNGYSSSSGTVVTGNSASSTVQTAPTAAATETPVTAAVTETAPSPAQTTKPAETVKSSKTSKSEKSEAAATKNSQTSAKKTDSDKDKTTDKSTAQPENSTKKNSSATTETPAKTETKTVAPEKTTDKEAENSASEKSNENTTPSDETQTPETPSSTENQVEPDAAETQKTPETKNEEKTE